MGGRRLKKTSRRIATFGALDEVGAHLGLARAALDGRAPDLAALLTRLGHELFVAQAELASPAAAPAHRIEARHVARLESEIDRYSRELTDLESFVLPGGSTAGAELHVARAVARRAERELWALDAEEPLSPELLAWTNRLSDLLFALALSANRSAGVAEVRPDYTV